MLQKSMCCQPPYSHAWVVEQADIEYTANIVRPAAPPLSVLQHKSHDAHIVHTLQYCYATRRSGNCSLVQVGSSWLS